MTDLDARHIELTREYFRRSDAQDPSLLDLLHPQLQFYFPKFGIGHGPQAIWQMVAGFAGQIESIEHDVTDYLFIARAPHVIVEGTTRGRLNGKDWQAGVTPGGRFCNVFEFRDGLILRCHVYLDPDYTGEDAARFRWGQEGREW
ncbi:nuclear transport factor 2 family protein [Paracoccus nototheniae]|uniref:Nuclear transport factor 2 family protein n=1 Tax=Paracoccus nototheniae TaxID=2489002 RepID=A0ABW4DX92_9RHOB|nr:nuclear transport factor 2 family protein [Paracoccus nototheniae]